ncbi:MAG: hypothetical protein JO051_17820 [Acidobacteriaceae bacterium]|nr:hypothetical protein [Acidobacteriaceae bacterium]
MPERLVRSLSALSGGLLKELGNVAVPPRLRRTSLYRTAVEITLRFMIQELGQVQNIYPTEDHLSQNFLLERGASHGIALLGLLTLHVSPIWILATLADAAGAGGALINEVSQALKDEGLLDRDTRFETVDQLLDGLEQSSAHLADTLNTPPLDVAALRREWAQLKTELALLPRHSLPSPAMLRSTWHDLIDSARVQNRSVFALCSAVAISSITDVPANLLWLSRAARVAATRTGTVVGGVFLDHYKSAVIEIRDCGFLSYWRRQFRPYLRAAAEQFVGGKLSTTERLVLRRRGKPVAKKS